MSQNAPLPKVSTPEQDRQLLSPDFMARLEQLEVVSRKIHASRMKGERKSKRKGESAEFADYRNYVIGDDLRHIDWNIYARLDKLFLKLFLEEEELNVSILLDISGSMDSGEPDKAVYAKRVAAALGYIGLSNYNRVNLYAYHEGIASRLAGLRGRRNVAQMVSFLEELPVGGKSHLAAAAKAFAMRHTSKGVCMVISDLLDKAGFESALRYLLGRQLDVCVLQVLSPQETNPELTGDLKLVDCEDEDVAEVTISRPLLDRYKVNLQAYCEHVREYCNQRGIAYFLSITNSPFETLILSYLRLRGLLR